MGFRYRPSLRIGNIRIGRTGASVRTGIPGLTFRHNFSSGSGGSPDQDQADQPGDYADYGFGDLAGSVFLFALLLWVVRAGLGLVNTDWHFLVPFFFLWSAIKPLVRTYRYGKKQQAVHKQDQRYKTGSRVTGYETVTDRSNKMYYTPTGLTTRRIEGIIKLSLIGYALYSAYPSFNASMNKAKPAKAATMVVDSTSAKPAAIHKKHHKHRSTAK